MALFVGSSGVGKTMAAEALAGALGLDLDLDLVNLASVVDKYIGETVKKPRTALRFPPRWTSTSTSWPSASGCPAATSATSRWPLRSSRRPTAAASAMLDLVRSTSLESRKLGRLCTAQEFGPWHDAVMT